MEGDTLLIRGELSLLIATIILISVWSRWNL